MEIEVYKAENKWPNIFMGFTGIKMHPEKNDVLFF